MEQFVVACLTCQQTKYPTTKPQGLLQPLPVPTMPRTEISMDFAIGLPSSRGYTTIFVVMDRLTKNAHFSALKRGFTAKIVTTVFMESIVKLHDFPLLDNVRS